MNRPALLTLWTAALLGECSLINSFDDVKPLDEETGGRGGRGGSEEDGGADGGRAGSGGTGGTGGAMADAADGAPTSDASMDAAVDGAPDGSMGMGGIDAGPESGSTGGAGGSPDDGGEDAFVPGGPNGAIVAFDDNDDADNVPPLLWVLDPETGEGLSSETIGTVEAIAHDPDTDRWYIFEQPGTAGEPFQLHVRELNTTTGDWRRLGSAAVPPPASASAVGVLNDRIAYLTGMNGETFTVLDTSDPTNVSIVGMPNRNLPDGRIEHLIGVKGRNVGGTFTVMFVDCTAIGDTCSVNLTSFVVSNTGVQPSTAGVTRVGEVSRVSGTAGLSFDPLDGAEVVVLPPTTLAAGTTDCSNIVDSAQGSAQKFDPVTLTALGPAVPFDIQSLRIQRVSHDPCHNATVVATLLEDTGLFVVPLANGSTPNKTCVTGITSGLTYEPYTRITIRTVLGALQAWEIAGSDDAPTLRRKTLPSIPNGFDTNIFAVRQPSNIDCN